MTMSTTLLCIVATPLLALSRAHTPSDHIDRLRLHATCRGQVTAGHSCLRGCGGDHPVHGKGRDLGASWALELAFFFCCFLRVRWCWLPQSLASPSNSGFQAPRRGSGARKKRAEFAGPLPPFAFRAAKLTPVLGVFATCIIAGLPAAPGLRLSPGRPVLFHLAQVGSSVASCRPYILSAGSCLALPVAYPSLQASKAVVPKLKQGFRGLTPRCTAAAGYPGPSSFRRSRIRPGICENMRDCVISSAFVWPRAPGLSGYVLSQMAGWMPQVRNACNRNQRLIVNLSVQWVVGFGSPTLSGKSWKVRDVRCLCRMRQWSHEIVWSRRCNMGKAASVTPLNTVMPSGTKS